MNDERRARLAGLSRAVLLELASAQPFISERDIRRAEWEAASRATLSAGEAMVVAGQQQEIAFDRWKITNTRQADKEWREARNMAELARDRYDRAARADQRAWERLEAADA